MRTFKKVLFSILFVTSLVFATGCFKKDYKELLSTSWFAEGNSDPSFILYDDGTCEIAGEYGIGKWEIVNDNELKLTNYYGETETVPIISVEDGCLTLGTVSEESVSFWDTAEKALTASKEIKAEDENAQDNLIEYTWYGDYSDGYAWIKYEKDSKQYWASIDKSGKVICSFDADLVNSVFPYENGYAYLKYNNKFEVINISGGVTASYPLDDNNMIRAYGDGYVLLQTYAADFDTSGYTYTIYNYDETVLEKFDSQTELGRTHYCGNGVFAFRNSFYSATEGTWTDYETEKSDVVFLEDITAIDVNYADPDKDGYRGKLCLMKKNGELSEVPLYPEYGWGWSETGLTVHEDICVLYEFYDDQLLSYNLKDGKVYKLDDYYAEKVIWDELPDPLAFFSNRIVLPMRGNDGNRYIAVFDHEWNAICDPIQVKSSSVYSDNRLVVSTDNDTVVYDEKGNEVFSLTAKGFSKIEAYHDGVARVEDRTKGEVIPTYLDKNGKVLFEKINFENTAK